MNLLPSLADHHSRRAWVRFAGGSCGLCLSILLLALPSVSMAEVPRNLAPKPIAADASVKYDYDIVYVRAPRTDDPKKQGVWADVKDPLRGVAGSDLVVLHPNGSEDVLVEAGKDAIVDPAVSFDAQWVYFARIQFDAKGASAGSDIFKVRVETREVVRLTHQEYTPNTGIAASTTKPRIFNLGPCPAPGGKLVFTSNRNGFVPPRQEPPVTLQLFAMDDDGRNVEQIGHLNLSCALHPTILRDGRIMFSSHETQGLRAYRVWGIWTIHPDGSEWNPLVSAFHPRDNSVFHFAGQLSDGRIVFEEYYHTSNMGFGTFHVMDEKSPEGTPGFGPGNPQDPRNGAYRGSKTSGFSFGPHGLKALTPFTNGSDSPADLSDPKDLKSPRNGKPTHPTGAPDNHLLLAYSSGPVHKALAPAIDSGIYLLKGGQPIAEPGQLLLIKNDPKYNEKFPRALVPYKRMYGIDEPARTRPVVNNGTQSPQLPAGAPFGLIGTSSLYKRETYPNGVVPKGKVTGEYPGGKSGPFQGLGAISGALGENGAWFGQGADAGRYTNDDIHSVRILAMEPTTDPKSAGLKGRLFWNYAGERLRILGEFPARKFVGTPGANATGLAQPLDPDGNPDTSFLVKLPADAVWTFQTLDKRGMVLNMSQTWHQVRPGEVRTNCGGCHAHSQKPTDFALTAAAHPDYVPFDLTQKTPLLTTKAFDESGKQWDVKDETGLRFTQGVKNVEFHRDVQPILNRSCVACHTKDWEKPAGGLVLDESKLASSSSKLYPQTPFSGQFPLTYVRLAADGRGTFGTKSLTGDWVMPQLSRYVRVYQSRRSLLVWKVFGERLDGWSNDDFVTETVPGDRSSLVKAGKPATLSNTNKGEYNFGYHGSSMPPPDAVAGTYVGPKGEKIKVAPLSAEDKLTLVRWIDLGCPIDMDFDPANPDKRGKGWMADETRPTLTLAEPKAGRNERVSRILIGMHDFDTGLDLKSFKVTADFAIDGVPAGENLAGKFRVKSPGVWEYVLAQPPAGSAQQRLTVTVRDGQGNESRVERSFAVGAK